MSAEFSFRLIGMIALTFGGGYLGYIFYHQLPIRPDSPTQLWVVVFGLVGALIGLVATPFVTTRPARAVRNLLTEIPATTLVAGLIGMSVGLVLGVLFSVPLSYLPAPLNQYLPVTAAVLLGWTITALFVLRQRDIFSIFRGRAYGRIAAEGMGTDNESRSVLLDTSVIIDGRIADISRTGFIAGSILVPKFVLNELQHIADSADPLRRNRGRRGLEVLNHLQKESVTPVRFTDMDVPDIHEVDDKLVALAKHLNCAVVTNDYNLNHVAQLQGVSILNINELANAVKAVFLPGETLHIKIIQSGKEPGQGVGYLDDGTMVVVDEGHRYLNEDLDVIVTKVFQTTAGRMIFARPDKSSDK